jgi:hypothetical protein
MLSDEVSYAGLCSLVIVMIVTSLLVMGLCAIRC